METFCSSSSRAGTGLVESRLFVEFRRSNGWCYENDMPVKIADCFLPLFLILIIHNLSIGWGFGVLGFGFSKMY